MNEIDPADVARFLLKELNEADGYLYEEDAVDRIEEEYGRVFLVENETGELAIAEAVLDEFLGLTESTIVWDRGARAWRWRDENDSLGPQQA